VDHRGGFRHGCGLVLHAKTLAMVMDLFTADQLSRKPWKLAKLSAFMCFGVACGLLGASLILSPAGTLGSSRPSVVPMSAAVR
jgi:hypothetical protein